MALTRVNSVRDFFRIWFFWKSTALFMFAVILSVIMSFSYTSTPVYESRAELLLLPKTSEGMVFSTGNDEKRISPVSSVDINTEIALMLGNEVIGDTVKSLDKKGLGLKTARISRYAEISGYLTNGFNTLLETLGLVGGPRSPFDTNAAILKNALTIEPVFESNIIQVTLRSEVPEAAREVLNRFLSVYIKHHNSVYTNAEGIGFFEDQSKIYLGKLRTAEKQLKKFQRDNRIVDLAWQNESNIKLIADLERELKRIQISCDEAESRFRSLKGSFDGQEGDLAITREMRNLPSILLLEEGIIPILIKRSEIHKRFTTESREYRDINTQIEMLRAEVRNEIKKAIKTEELELKSLHVKRASLEKKIEQLSLSAIEINQNERILSELEREVKLARNNYMLYASKTEDARITSERLQRDLVNVSIADSPTLPVRPVSPNRMQALLLALALGLFTALGSPFLLESLDRKLKTTDDVEVHLALPVVCSFPELK